MFLSESIWLKEKLSTLDLPAGGQVLDIGSSTFEFKQKHQPYIDENVFAPLEKRGLIVTHADKKVGRGVDKVIDIERAVNFRRPFDLVICTNVLEHLVDTARAAKNILSLVKTNGYLLVSAPFVCPYHQDPIDTFFRVSNHDLEKLFSGQKVLASAIVSSPSPTTPSLEGKVSIVLLQIVSPLVITNSLKEKCWIVILALRNLVYQFQKYLL